MHDNNNNPAARSLHTVTDVVTQPMRLPTVKLQPCLSVLGGAIVRSLVWNSHASPLPGTTGTVLRKINQISGSEIVYHTELPSFKVSALFQNPTLYFLTHIRYMTVKSNAQLRRATTTSIGETGEFLILT